MLQKLKEKNDKKKPHASFVFQKFNLHSQDKEIHCKKENKRKTIVTSCA